MNAADSMRIHRGLTYERWWQLSILEQLANVGCDASRAIRHKKQDKPVDGRLALERMLELLDATTFDPKNKKRLKELLRIREMFIDFFLYENEYKSSEEFWEQYFYDYNYAAAIERGR